MKRLVFLDESGVNTSMTRLYGRAPLGERCVGTAPGGHWQTSTLLSAMRLTGPIEPATLLLDGPIDGVSFRGYVERFLAPALKRGDVVVMDNLASHKVAGVAEAIASRGARVCYLPPYSPDLNPIEKLWSKIKTLVRRGAARTQHALLRAVAAAFRAVAPTECRNYFASCGYATLACSML